MRRVLLLSRLLTIYHFEANAVIRKNFNVESIADPKVRESVRALLMRSQANANESARFRREQQGQLYKIERRHNVIAHSTRMHWLAVREAMS